MKNLKHKLLVLTFIILTMAILIASTKQATFHADSANIRYISTAVGENETSVGINYHVNVSGSYIKLSKYSGFPMGYSVISPTERTFEDAGTSGDSSTGFSSRYICTAYLTNLDENTTYYYRVVANDEESSTHSFKTYSSSGDTCNILFTTDLHADAGYNTSKRGNTSLTNIINGKNINLAIMTGDQVDRGGYESEWITFFNGYTVFNNLLQASIPGNHEYYHSKDGAYVSPYFYNQFYANPQNGPTSRLNSTYAFTYGDALIIMIDTIKQELLKEQKDWFRGIMRQNTKKWVIVGTHAGCISAGAYASDASWMKTYWLPLFEEYQVDLALSGHEHIYIRSDLQYKTSTNSDLGVTYLVGCAGSHKQYSVGSTGANYVVKSTNYSSNVIEITPNSLKCTLYDENGTKTDQSFTLSPKRNTVTPQSDDTLLNELNVEYNKTEQELNLSWPGTYFGNVSKITIEELSPSTSSTEIYIPSSKITSTKVLNVFTDYNYEYKFTLSKHDGTTISKNFTITNRYEHNLNLVLNGGAIDNPDNYLKYFDNGNTKLPTPTKDGEVFEGWYLNSDFSGTKYTKITPDLTGDLTFYAKYITNHNLIFVTNTDITINSESLLEGSAYILPRLSSDDKKIFIGWHLKSDFSDNPISEITMGSTDLSVYAEWDFLETEEPQPEKTKKKCGKKNLELIELFFMLSLLGIVIRRKK